MKKEKTGQALPLNTIIIAILVVIVLVVVIMMFSDSVGDSGKTFSACESKGGVCVRRCGGGSMPLYSDCTEEGDICCSKSPNKDLIIEYEEVE